MTGHTTNYYSGEGGGKKCFLQVDFEQSHRRQSVVRSSATYSRERSNISEIPLTAVSGPFQVRPINKNCLNTFKSH